MNEIPIKIFEQIIFQTAEKGPIKQTLWKFRQQCIFYHKVFFLEELLD